MTKPLPHGRLNDPATAFNRGRYPGGSCAKHGGTDDPKDCEWCELNRLFNNEECVSDPPDTVVPFRPRI